MLRRYRLDRAPRLGCRHERRQHPLGRECEPGKAGGRHDRFRDDAAYPQQRRGPAVPVRRTVYPKGARPLPRRDGRRVGQPPASFRRARLLFGRRLGQKQLRQMGADHDRRRAEARGGVLAGPALYAGVGRRRTAVPPSGEEPALQSLPRGGPAAERTDGTGPQLCCKAVCRAVRRRAKTDQSAGRNSVRRQTVRDGWAKTPSGWVCLRYCEACL